MLRDEENSLEKQLTPGRCRLSAAFNGGGRRTVPTPNCGGDSRGGELPRPRKTRGWSIRGRLAPQAGRAADRTGCSADDVGRRQHPRSPNLARMRAARLRGGKAPTYADQLIEELRHLRSADPDSPLRLLDVWSVVVSPHTRPCVANTGPPLLTPASPRRPGAICSRTEGVPELYRRRPDSMCCRRFDASGRTVSAGRLGVDKGLIIRWSRVRAPPAPRK
jgi:hypothetical protein